jgi:hypothetical protein
MKERFMRRKNEIPVNEEMSLKQRAISCLYPNNAKE